MVLHEVQKTPAVVYPTWVEDQSFRPDSDYSPVSVDVAFQRYAALRGKTVYAQAGHGKVADVERLWQAISEKMPGGGFCGLLGRTLAKEMRVYYWPEAYLRVTVELGEYNTSFLLASTDPEHSKAFAEVFLEHAETEDPRPGGDLNVVCMGMNGPRLQRLARINALVVPTNYSDATMADLKWAIDDIKSPTPSGRICIFDGPTGTGKTYLIRAMISAVPKCLYIYVPVQMLSSLADPQFLPMLLSEREDDQPIVLIIEDADDVVDKRKTKAGPKGRVSDLVGLSNLLNFGEGLLSEALNLRILCTTNKPISEVDLAILRAGRLSRRISVDLLSPADAKRCWNALCPEGPEMTFEAPVSLAEIYQRRREAVCR